jgi:lysozyme
MKARHPIAAAFAAALAGGLIGFTARHEGYRSAVYPDPAHGWAVPTICYGHTRAVVKGQMATQEECALYLTEDYREVGAALERLVKVPVTPDQALALADFVFNIGQGAFAKSTLLAKLNAGDCLGAANEFPRWVYSNGKRLSGLTKRRADEKALFKKDCEEDSP